MTPEQITRYKLKREADNFFVSANLTQVWPLYTPFQFAEQGSMQRQLQVDAYASLCTKEVSFDGHCIGCKRITYYTSKLTTSAIQNMSEAGLYGARKLTLTCGRNDNHNVYVWLFNDGNGVQKVGQFPSMFDLAAPDALRVGGALGDAFGADFRRAVACSAHGYHVGAFCYLRRIFERLVLQAEAKEKELNADFVEAIGMKERIANCKHALPEFMVQNAVAYNILSGGVHEFSDDECANLYELMSKSIMHIVTDAERKREDVESRKLVSSAIAKFNSIPRE